MNRLKKSVVAAGLSAGMIGGGAAGVVFGSPLSLGAQESSTTIPGSADSTTPPKDSEDWSAKRTEHLQSTLKPLVDAGTITRAQSDAVVKALSDAMPTRDEARKRRSDRPATGRGFLRTRAGLEALSELLDATPGELGKLMADGQTLAQIAESKGVAPQKVIDTLVAAAKKGLDEAVKAGRMTQADADQKLADATKAITDGVSNGTFKLGHRGRGPFGGHLGDPAPDANNGDETTPPAPGD